MKVLSDWFNFRLPRNGSNPARYVENVIFSETSHVLCLQMLLPSPVPAKEDVTVSLVTRHTSHVTRHTSHVTRHT